MIRVLRNQIFLWKLCFRTCPGYMLYHLYDGFRYQGVYQYSYDYLQNYQKENGLSTAEYEDWINSFLASGKTAPIAVGSDGKVIMDTNTGQPQRMKNA